MAHEDAARIADDRLRGFVASMAAAGNPGCGRHEIGMHHVEGWVLDYDPAMGGSQIQAVIGTDGAIHALREPRSLRTRKLSGAEWALRDVAGADHGAALLAATQFAERLDHILDFDRHERRGLDGDQAPWAALPDD